jgi:DNA-binding FrmR family transcriptional regulator
LSNTLVELIFILAKNFILIHNKTMLFSKKPVPKSVGKHFIHSDEQKKKLSSAINRIIGQLETIKTEINNNDSCDESLVQIMAIKGGVEKLGREMVGNGILDCLDQYSRQELEIVIKNLFKLD